MSTITNANAITFINPDTVINPDVSEEINLESVLTPGSILFNMIIPILPNPLPKRGFEVINISFDNMNLLDRAYMEVGKVHNFIILSQVNRVLNQFYKEPIKTLTSEVVNAVKSVHESRNGEAVIRQCIDSSIHLLALKIYFFHQPQALLKKVPDPERNYAFSTTILHAAVSCDPKVISISLINYILRINREHQLKLLLLEDSDLNSPLQKVFKSFSLPNKNVTQLLIDAFLNTGSASDANSSDAIFPYFILSGSRHIETQKEFLRLWISKKKDINVQNEEGNTALHLFAIKKPNHENGFRQLVELNAQINIRNKKGKTPLEILLEAFASPSVLMEPSHDYRTINKHTDRPIGIRSNIEFLLTQGATITASCLRWMDPTNPNPKLFECGLKIDLDSEYRKVTKAMEATGQVNWMALDNEENTYLHLIVQNITGKDSVASGKHLDQYCQFMAEKHPKEFKQQLQAKNREGLTPFALLQKLDQEHAGKYSTIVPLLKSYQVEDAKPSVEQATSVSLQQPLSRPSIDKARPQQIAVPKSFSSTFFEFLITPFYAFKSWVSAAWNSLIRRFF